MHKCASIAVIALAFTALTTRFCYAQSDVVIPNDNANTAGPSNNAFPFNGGSPMRVQQVFAADQLAGQSGAITQIAFRVDEDPQFGYPFNTPNIQTEIRLCHTTRNPQGLSTTFDDNLGNDVTLVYNGPLTLSSSGNGFDITIDIDDTFIYDGAGNILVEYKVRSNAITVQFDAAGTGYGAGGLPSISRLWAFGADATTGSTGGDDGYVTQLTFAGGGGGYRLSLDGDCPGTVQVGWSGATANAQQAIVFGNNQGSTMIPNNYPCSGTTLGIAGGVMQIGNYIPTGSGSGQVNGNAGAFACGHYLQLVEGGSCNTSNVAQIP